MKRVLCEGRQAQNIFHIWKIMQLPFCSSLPYKNFFISHCTAVYEFVEEGTKEFTPQEFIFNELKRKTWNKQNLRKCFLLEKT